MRTNNAFFIVLLTAFCVWLPLTQVQAGTRADIEKRVFKLINRQRTLVGLAHLKNNTAMKYTARQHSKDMAQGIVAFGHDGFSARVASIDETVGYASSAGENVAHTSKTTGIAKALVTAWLNSPEHLANIETTDFNLTGIGIGKSGDDYYCTQIFVDNQ